MTATQAVSRSSRLAVPPRGSRIEVEQSGSATSIIVPYSSGGNAKYLAVAFMLFWLGGWAVGFTDVSSQIANGKGSAFLVFWLGAWTLGGAWAAYTVFRLVRPSIPERLELHNVSFRYDSGRPPLQWPGLTAPRSAFAWPATPRRIEVDLPAAAILTLRLRDTEFRNRLTIDHFAERIELAKDANDIEREWLFEVLTARYASQAKLQTA